MNDKAKKAAYAYFSSILEKVFIGLLMATFGFYLAGKKDGLDFTFLYLTLVNFICFIGGLFFTIKGAKYE